MCKALGQSLAPNENLTLRKGAFFLLRNNSHVHLNTDRRSFIIQIKCWVISISLFHRLLGDWDSSGHLPAWYPTAAQPLGLWIYLTSDPPVCSNTSFSHNPGPSRWLQALLDAAHLTVSGCSTPRKQKSLAKLTLPQPNMKHIPVQSVFFQSCSDCESKT